MKRVIHDITRGGNGQPVDARKKQPKISRPNRKLVHLGGIEARSTSFQFTDVSAQCKKLYFRLRSYVSSWKHAPKNTTRSTSYLVTTSQLPSLERATLRATGSVSLARTSLMIVGLSIAVLVFINFLNAVSSTVQMKKHVVDNIKTGIDDILLAKDTLLSIDLANAEQNFTDANVQFTEALETITSLNGGIELWPGSPFDTSFHILKSGELLSSAGISATKSLESIMNDQEYIRGLEFADATFTNVLDAYEHLQKVSPDEIPEEYRERFVKAYDELEKVVPIVTKFQGDIPTMKRMLGSDYPRRYFIAFQNVYESRGLGGFMGSYGILDLNDGKVSAFAVHDVYDIDWQMFEDVPAPDGMSRYMNTVKLRDANYLPDTPSAAEYIRYFYEHSGGTSFDGLIVIDQTMLGNVLELTGPITLDEYNLTIDADNYFDMLQYIIETSKDDPEGPKQILKDLSPQISEKLLGDIDHSLLLSYVLEGLRDKHISVYMMEPDLQETVEHWNLTQSMYEAPYSQDYFSPIHTNVGGNKDDRWIEESYVHNSRIEADGSITNTVTITMEHTFSAEARRDLYKKIPQLASESTNEQDRLLYILGDSPYRDFLRIYVPLGSEIVSVQGLPETDTLTKTELNKTVFGLHLSLMPGETKTYTITYTLPFSYKPTDAGTYTYELVAQKQFGRAGSTLTKAVELDSAFTFTNDAPDIIPNAQMRTFDINFVHDQYYAEQFKRL